MKKNWPAPQVLRVLLASAAENEPIVSSDSVIALGEVVAISLHLDRL